MSETVERLVLDLIEWLVRCERSYQETMAAWRTTCPRLPVWEDASDRGLVALVAHDGDAVVRPTAAGLALLRDLRPATYDQLAQAWPPPTLPLAATEGRAATGDP